MAPLYEVGRSMSTDYFGLRDQLKPDDLELMLTARAFVDDEVLPVIGGFWERAEFPWPSSAGWASSAGRATHRRATAARRMSPTASGLVAHGAQPRRRQHRHRSSACSPGWPCASIAMLGSDEQKQRWLPALARSRPSARSR